MAAVYVPQNRNYFVSFKDLPLIILAYLVKVREKERKLSKLKIKTVVLQFIKGDSLQCTCSL